MTETRELIPTEIVTYSGYADDIASLAGIAIDRAYPFDTDAVVNVETIGYDQGIPTKFKFTVSKATIDNIMSLLKDEGNGQTEQEIHDYLAGIIWGVAVAVG